jgi:predicted transcriptional regulator
MTETKLLSDELLQQVVETARAQNREAAEVVEEAVGKYLASQRLERFAERMGRRAAAKNIREEDVPQLVDEVRRENEARGR